MEKPVRKVDFLEEKGTKRTEAIIKQAQKSAKSEKIKNRNIKNTKKLLKYRLIFHRHLTTWERLTKK